MTWKIWAQGLLAAVIGGASNGVTLVIVDPVDFNLTTGWHKLVSVVVVNALISAALYLKQSPIAKD